MNRNILLPIKRKVLSFMRGQEAVSATEYAIMLALIVLGSMAVIQMIGEDYEIIYTNIEDSLPDE